MSNNVPSELTGAVDGNVPTIPSNDPDNPDSNTGQTSPVSPDPSETPSAQTGPNEVNSKGKIINTGETHVVNQFGQLTAIFSKIHESGEEREDWFSDLALSWPPDEEDTPEFIYEDIENYLEGFRTHRLILIGCPNEKITLFASNALRERLGISDSDQSKKFDIQEILEHKVVKGIKSFLPQEKATGTKAVIRMNALYSSAQGFLSTLISNLDRYESLKHALREKDVYLIWMVKSSYIDELLGKPKEGLIVPCWKIPFLRPRLKEYFPERYLELEEIILRQQKNNKWGEDEDEFCRRFLSALNGNYLIDQIEKLKGPPLIAAESIFKDHDYIEKSVLYVASCFRDLAPHEFSYLVESLLGDRKVMVSGPEYKTNEDGSQELIYTRTEVPIARIWRDNKDTIIWNHLQETNSSDGSTSVIDFSNYVLRDGLSKFLQEKRRFYLKDQFRMLQSHGFLFYQSTRIAENMIRFTVDMMTAYPGEFGKEWLVQLILNSREMPLVYSRASELMRQLLKNSQMKDLVDGCLAELLKRDHFAVLSLVRRLRFVPEVDEFYWIKQLFDQGNEATRSMTYKHLYSHIKRLGTQIFEENNILEKWLPKENRAEDRYPASSVYVLRSLIQYYIEALDDMEASSYGVWPNPYPLFTFTDKETAEKSLNQLMRWFFHPAMKQVLDQIESDIGTEILETSTQLVGYVIANWYFILLGPDNRNSENESITEANSDLNAVTMTNILMMEVARTTNSTQRKELIEYWEVWNAVFRIEIKRTDYSKRPELVWRNYRLWELETSFKKLCGELGLECNP